MLYALYAGIALGLVALAAGGIVLLIHVEDWSRDLTTNVAATDPQAADERLRPVHAGLSVAELAKLVSSVASALPGWEVVRGEQREGMVELHCVRTTALMRYKDDIRVRIQPAEGGSLLTAESRSRVGRGDLGQNPRNLRQLLEAVRERL